MTGPRIRVAAYVIRVRTVAELLVFDHVGMPEAGTQVPDGGVEPGEELASAVLREAAEETGLTTATVTGRVAVDGRPHPHTPQPRLTPSSCSGRRRTPTTRGGTGCGARATTPVSSSTAVFSPSRRTGRRPTARTRGWGGARPFSRGDTRRLRRGQCPWPPSEGPSLWPSDGSSGRVLSAAAPDRTVKAAVRTFPPCLKSRNRR